MKTDETPQVLGRYRENSQRVARALAGTRLALYPREQLLLMRSNARLVCENQHVFERAVGSILKWKSNRCPTCFGLSAEKRGASDKLPNPNSFDWIPKVITLGRGTKPRDLRGVVFGSLTAETVIGKHRSGSLLWDCKCRCGNKVTKKSSSLTSGKATSCGCMRGSVKAYKTVAPNKGKTYTIKANDEHFRSRKAWGDAVKKNKGDSCEVCGWSYSPCDVHHIIERNRGGKNTIENSLVLCPNHHRTAHTQEISVLLGMRAARNRLEEAENGGASKATKALEFSRYLVLLMDYENDNSLFRSLWASALQSLNLIRAEIERGSAMEESIFSHIRQIELWSSMFAESFGVPYQQHDIKVIFGSDEEQLPKDLFRMVTT